MIGQQDDISLILKRHRCLYSVPRMNSSDLKEEAAKHISILISPEPMVLAGLYGLRCYRVLVILCHAEETEYHTAESQFMGCEFQQV